MTPNPTPRMTIHAAKDPEYGWDIKAVLADAGLADAHIKVSDADGYLHKVELGASMGMVGNDHQYPICHDFGAIGKPKDKPAARQCEECGIRISGRYLCSNCRYNLEGEA